MRRVLALALAGACLGMAAGCSGSGQDCSNRAFASVVVTIKDARNGTAICGATVHVVAPAPEHGAVGACPYSVYGSSPATYTLEISAAGYVTPAPITIKVPSTGGACAHAVTQTYTAKLQPRTGGNTPDAGADGG